MADQDLDDELLALAGGGSPEEATGDVKQSIESPGGLQRPSPHTNASNSHSFNTNGTSKLRGGEVEASQASSPDRNARMGSVSISEGSYGSRSSFEGAAEDRTLYPIEGKFTSQKDKKHIMSLPELERESILAERAQENDRRLQDMHLRRLYEMRAQAEERADRSSPAKRKAGPHEEESPRKSSRTKTRLDGLKAGMANEALGDLKRRRDEKAIRGKARLSDRHDRNRSSSSLSEDEGESDAEGPSQRSQEIEKRVEDGPPGLYEYDYLRITRSALERTCFYPEFEEKFIDYVVRVCLGQDHRTGESVYRIALIKDYIHDRPYWMEGTHNNRPFITTQHVNLRIGEATKSFPFTAISNSPFTQAEYDRWLTETKTAKTDGSKRLLPAWTRSKAHCEESYQWLKGWFNRSFTDEDINFKVSRSKSLQNEYIQNRKAALAERYTLATEKGDDVTIARTEAEVAELEKGNIFFGRNDVNFPKAPTTTINKQQERLAELNRQNRAANTRDVRQAQLRERAAARKAAAAVERGEQAPDPFARVKTVPKTHFDGIGLDVPKPKMTPSPGISRTGTPVNVVSAGKKEVTRNPTRHTQIKTVKGLPVISHKPTDDEVIGAMDFGIDLEI